MAAPLMIAVMGPTASGKSALALELAERLNGEIVTVDLAQVYQGMDIGTAKPSADEQHRIPHHLLDLCSPLERYSVDEFVQDAHSAISDILDRGRLPVLAGGTMLYFRALFAPMADLPPSDPGIRAQLTEEADRLGVAQLHSWLADVDPEAAGSMHPNNRQRVMRALEVYRVSGKPISAYWAEQGDWPAPGSVSSDLPWTVTQLAVSPSDRAVLHERINQRFLGMLSDGFVDEVRALKQLPGLTGDHPSMRSVGYRQVWQWLATDDDGDAAYEQMIARAQAASRQLAKRQLTWLRGWRNLATFDTLQPNLSERVLRFLNHEFPSTL